MDNSDTKLMVLNHECDIFCRYLTDASPSTYVMAKYRDGHECGDFGNYQGMSRFDRFVLWGARRSLFSTRLLDSYLRVFDNTSILRKKLILLLAILESCAPEYEYFEKADPVSKPILFLIFLAKGIGFMVNIAISMMLIAPIQLILSFSKRQSCLKHG